MCPRRAVLQIPSKPLVSPRLPLYKIRHSLTRPESTLPQVLIPLHFKSFISNAYKKPGAGCFRPAPKFGNSSLPAPLPSGHARTPRTSIPSFTSAHLPSPLGVGTGVPQRHRFPTPPLPRPQTCHPEGIEGSALLFGPHGTRITEHASQPTNDSGFLRASAISAPLRYPFPLFAVRRHSLLTPNSPRHRTQERIMTSRPHEK
jgi:hypothetical protein